MEERFAVQIAAPRESVWRVLADVERWPEWTPSVTEAHRLDSGPLAVGSRTRLRQPRTRPLVWTVTELEPETTFTCTAASGGTTLTARHRLSDGPKGVTLENTVVVGGWSARLLLPFVGRQIRRYLRLETEGLKRHCEARAAHR